LNINSARRRKGISPVLATVILIAITLIAAIAIAGFVFGLFGSFTSSARVEVSYASLAGGAAPAGSVVALNTGTSNTNVNSMTLTYGGQTCAPAVTGAPVSVTAGAAPGVTLTVTAGTCAAVPAHGQAYTGSLALSNGGQVPFSGVFS